MRIIFYCQEESPANIDNYLQLGASGTVSALMLVSAGLTRLGHEVWVLNRSASGVYQGTRHLRSRSPAEAQANLSAIGGGDVFVANGFAAEIFLNHDIAAGKRIYWSHNFIDHKPYERAIEQGRLDYVFCISRNQLSTWWRSPAVARTTNIHNGVDVEAIAPFRNGGVLENKIMFIGAPRASKGFHDAVRIFNAFRARNPGYQLFVAGSADLHGNVAPLGKSGIFEQEYEDRYLNEVLYAADGSLRAGIVLMGKVTRAEILAHLSTTRLALQNPSWTSQPEVHSIAALEIQAMGVPVVSNFRGGQPEVVRDGRTGILVKTRNDGGVVRAMEAITRDPKRRAAFSRNAVSYVETNFGKDKIARDWDEKLRWVAAGRDFRFNRGRALLGKIRHRLHI
ncbi:MAG: glycosyltransferase family 4 protein [Verrucomicrobiota bacterium]